VHFASSAHREQRLACAVVERPGEKCQAPTVWFFPRKSRKRSKLTPPERTQVTSAASKLSESHPSIMVTSRSSPLATAWLTDTGAAGVAASSQALSSDAHKAIAGHEHEVRVHD